MTTAHAVAIAFYPHHVEHLAPVCALMQLPLICCDSGGQQAAVASYPNLQSIVIRGLRLPDGVQRVLDYLRELRPSVIYYSDLIARSTLRAYFRNHAPVPRIVHCPHGFSEKRQTWARQIADQDIALMLGQHALDQLRAMGIGRPACTMVGAGHYRRRYFEQHRAFFASQRRAWGVEDDARRTLLYAPTWHDRIGSSSFFAMFATLTQRVPRGSRLVVKLHPHLEKQSALVDPIVASCAGRDDVAIVRNCPLVFPFLDCADVYIGDMSAMAYDFLAYDRPMFFLNQPAGTPTDASDSRLFECGTHVSPAQYAGIHSLIERESADAHRPFSALRASLDAYTFCGAASDDSLRDAIDAAVSAPPPAWMSATRES